MKRPRSLCTTRLRRLTACVTHLLLAGLVLAGTGCRLNSAARPIGPGPDITSVIIDPVTLKTVAGAPERLDALRSTPPKSEPEGDLDVEM